jgi:putative membrane protein
MIIVALVFATLAALLHVGIFVLESLVWTSPRARAVFGLSHEQALATKEMAFNQGFYNLFLAVILACGVVITATGSLEVGAALLFAGAGSMVAAATVLFASARDKRGAALKQGVLPLIAIVALVVGLSI